MRVARRIAARALPVTTIDSQAGRDGTDTITSVGVVTQKKRFTEANTDRADLCAAAVDAAITTALGGFEVATASPAEAELTRSALMDGVACYLAFDSPATDPGDIIAASLPVIHRYKLPGFS